MELFFVAVLVLIMAGALAMGFPVAFALPGSAILTIALASLTGVVFAGDVGAYFAQDGPIQWLTAGVTNFRGVYWEVERDTLIAVPLFVFMGIMLQRSKIAEDLLVTMAQLFGPVPGGLGISVVFVGALLAATTGIVGATVVAMGLISLPAMLRNNYSKPLATGTIAASGTLGQIIPPSIVLIILADQLSNATDQASTARKTEFKFGTGESFMPTEFDITSTSAGDMFLGALLPGIVLVGLYALYILVFAFLKKGSAPPVPYEGRYDLRFAGRVVLALVPPLTLILAVLGSIIMGIATVNQAGAIGAVGAMIMAGYRLKRGSRNAFYPAILAIVSIAAILFLIDRFDLNVKSIDNGHDALGITLATIAVVGLLVGVVWSAWRALKIDDTLRGVMIETAKTTSMVFIILLGAAMLTAAFRAFGGEDLVREFLGGLPGGFWAQFIVVMAVIFILGFFLDFIEIAVVVVPIIAPILLADTTANITAVWLGVMIGVNMQTSFLTPPFGFALFYLRGVAPPEVKTTDMYKGVTVFIALQLVGLAIVGTFPGLVNFLPNKSFLTAETAPPPQNPRLQACIEEHLFVFYDANGNRIQGAINDARALDLSVLPDKHATALRGSFDKADNVFALVASVRAAASGVGAYTAEYEPQHRLVRRLESQARKDGVKIEEIKREIFQYKRDGDQDAIDEANHEIQELETEQAELLAQIPATWKDARKQFVDLTGAERKARQTYRRTVDEAYTPIKELRAILADTQALADIGPQLRTLRDTVRSASPEDATAAIKAFNSVLSDIEQAFAIRGPLSKARRALSPRRLNRDTANSQLDDAIAAYEDELAWRQRADEALSAGLSRYNEHIRDSIGLRLQERLPDEITSNIASCLAVHRDISLNF
ncbi:MAG: C4-dicarboxylate ABC transporter permease [Alphaproteobacteria bacterium]|nr:C4-dicarboxylate ABC transporter permease [Alphaproteobacteria bacterium]